MQTSETKVAFEVASVKPSTFGPAADGLCRGGPGTSYPGLFTCRYVDLKRIVVRAFGVRTFQVVAPDWTQYQRFDIRAVVPNGATKEQFVAMLQNLLIGRFHLAFHRESPQARANGVLLSAGQETAPDVGPGGPSIQQALRDQLGLKLELKKGPVEMLIVDHVDRVPTEN